MSQKLMAVYLTVSEISLQRQKWTGGHFPPLAGLWLIARSVNNIVSRDIGPCTHIQRLACRAGAVLGKNIWGAWPLIIWEATTAKRNYYRTNCINQ